LGNGIPGVNVEENLLEFCWEGLVFPVVSPPGTERLGDGLVIRGLEPVRYSSRRSSQIDGDEVVLLMPLMIRIPRSCLRQCLVIPLPGLLNQPVLFGLPPPRRDFLSCRPGIEQWRL
jgi:hypothetical protein